MDVIMHDFGSEGSDESYLTGDTSEDEFVDLCSGLFYIDTPAGLYTSIPDNDYAIRLLYLLPGGWNDEIQCEMRMASLANPPKYDVLSHTWGDMIATSTICVNGLAVQISSNLKAALRCLRRSSSSLILWVDALCINQSCASEKTQQMSRAKLIYKKCTQLCVFLGPHHNAEDSIDTPQPALNPFIFLRLLARSKHQHIHDFNSTQVANMAGVANLNTVEAGDLIQLALAIIERSEWWDRIWAGQEIALAPAAKVMCGQWMIPWTSLVDYCARWLSHTSECCQENTYSWSSDVIALLRLIGQRCHRLEETRRLVGEGGGALDSFHFSELISHMLERECLDPRDKVFSVLGLLDDTESGGLQVDYRKTTRKTYEDAVARVVDLRQENALFLLGPAYGSGDAKRLSLPSWVPDLSRRVNHEEAQLRRDRNETFQANYDASKGRRSAAVIDSGEFFEVGIQVDVVTAVHQLPSPFKPANMVQWFDIAHFTQNRLGGGDASNNKDLFLAFWRSLQGNLKTAKHDFSTWRRLEEQDLREEDAQVFEACLRVSPSAKVFDGYGHMPLIVQDRALFFSQTRRWGFGTPQVRSGDEIWILHGSPVPFVLRPLRRHGEEADSGSGQAYSFIGDCYLDGVMFGEALSHPDYKEEVVILR